MEHELIVNLDPDMSPYAVEELKHAISMWRGVRGVEWQEVRPTQRAVDASPDTCEHGFMRGNCYVEICSFSKYGEHN